MPRLELIQGSEEWHAYRRDHIMATDSSILDGTNDFSSPLILWNEKLMVGKEKAPNAAMRRGNELEPKARELACEVIGIDFEPCVYECDDHSYMAASLDGLSKCGKYTLEIKCPSKDFPHYETKVGIIKPYYQTQIQHQLACSRAEKCYFFSYRPECEDPYFILEYTPDKDYIKTIRHNAKEFYIKICTMCPPEKPWVFQLK